MRVCLTVAYDGTDYHGWQIKPNGITIESVLHQALSDLLGEDILLIGASRTDAGVHALGNVAVFDTDTRMPAEKIAYALNQRLPGDIVAQDSKEVAADFHPRHCLSQKTYEYRILNRRFREPLKRRYTYFYHYALDVDKMQRAARFLVGEHDFKSFCSIHAEVETTVRTIYTLDVKKAGDEVTIRVCGNGFLYNMVRIVAGTLIEVGNGRLPVEQIDEILAAQDRSAAGPTAPACGLTMVGIEFL